MDEEIEDSVRHGEELIHYGVLGMKWGVRKDRKNSGTRKSMSPETKKKLVIGLSTAAALAVVAAGAVYVAKKKGITISSLRASKKTVSSGKTVTEKLLKEPTDIMVAARGKNVGYRFVKSGGLDDALPEYTKAFGASERTSVGGLFKRYGENSEKIAARFINPDGLKDAAGRVIPVDVIVPKHMASGINNMDDILAKVWPTIKKEFLATYKLVESNAL